MTEGSSRSFCPPALFRGSQELSSSSTTCPSSHQEGKEKSLRHTSPPLAKKNFCLCDLSGKRHRVFSSVTSVASVVPLCHLCRKKALCTFLNENPLFFGLRNVHSAFFPQRRHRGTT